MRARVRVARCAVGGVLGGLERDERWLATIAYRGWSLESVRD